MKRRVGEWGEGVDVPTRWSVQEVLCLRHRETVPLSGLAFLTGEHVHGLNTRVRREGQVHMNIEKRGGGKHNWPGLDEGVRREGGGGRER